MERKKQPETDYFLKLFYFSFIIFSLKKLFQKQIEVVAKNT